MKSKRLWLNWTVRQQLRGAISEQIVSLNNYRSKEFKKYYPEDYKAIGVEIKELKQLYRRLK